MRLTKESAAAILTFASSIAASPLSSQSTASIPQSASISAWPTRSANGTHIAGPTGYHNVSSSSTHTASHIDGNMGSEHKKFINLAVLAEEGLILKGLGCIKECWDSKQERYGNGNKPSYRECIEACKTNATLEHHSHNMSESGRASEVIVASLELGAKVRNDIVDYVKCVEGKDSNACIEAIKTKNVAHKSWHEYGTEPSKSEINQPFFNSTATTLTQAPFATATNSSSAATKPRNKHETIAFYNTGRFFAISMTLPASESSKAIGSVTDAAEFEEPTVTTVAVRATNTATSSSSLISVVGRPYPFLVEA